MTIRDLTSGFFVVVVLSWLIVTVTLRKYCKYCCCNERRTFVLQKKTDKLANLCFPCAFAATDCLRHFVGLIPPRSALVNIRRKALSPLMIFTQGRTVFCFYMKLKWYFKLEIIYESASLFNLKEKKIVKGKGIRTHTLNFHYTTLTIHLPLDHWEFDGW